MQWLVVAVLVAIAASYALWRLLPAEWKWRALQRVAPDSATAPNRLPVFIQSWVTQQKRKLVQGGCGSCGSNAAAKANPPNGNAK
jgi:hypothetical protein